MGRHHHPLSSGSQIVAYVAAWFYDPYIFGMLVLGLGCLQLAAGSVGLLGRLAVSSQPRNAWHLGNNIALIVAPAIALAFLRSIHWA